MEAEALKPVIDKSSSWNATLVRRQATHRTTAQAHLSLFPRVMRRIRENRCCSTRKELQARQCDERQIQSLEGASYTSRHRRRSSIHPCHLQEQEDNGLGGPDVEPVPC